METTDRLGFETLRIFATASSFNRWLYDTVSPYCYGEVLEIGSGIGNISEYLCNTRLPTTLSDSRAEYCEILKERFRNSDLAIRVFQLDISSKNFDNLYSTLIGTFDTVILLNVLEHIENRNLALSNCKKLIKRDGRLVILVPAFQKLYNSLDRSLGHFVRYNKSSLSKLLEIEGFNVYKLKYFNCPAILGWWLIGSVLKREQVNLRQLQIFDFFVPLFRLIDSLLNPFMGISVIAVAENKQRVYE